jgi:O-methyltransferase involved in polyketide biosynthesis
VDLVVNLAAGLDTRPYRMDLPRTLRWVEVDLPDILHYKERVLGGAAPACALERVRLDLSDVAGRRALFARLASLSTRALVVTEGLLIYLSAQDVASFARDLAAAPSFRAWITDISSPALLKLIVKHGTMVADAGAPFRFGPAEGPDFFVPLGWTPASVSSLLKTAGSLNRLPVFLKLISMLPEQPRPSPKRPWSAVMRLERRPA